VIADTTNQSTIYVTDKPDWGADYSFEKECITLINKSKNAAEQRARMRSRSRHALSYAIAAMSIAEASVRRAQAIKGLGAALGVPIWHAYEVVDSHVGDVITVETDKLLLRPFSEGGIAFLEHGENDPGGTIDVFVQILEVTADTITIDTPALYPAAAVVPTYNPGARIYPVILGIADENSVRFVYPDVNKATQLFDVIEL
jgi:hypothetical protein